MNICGGGEGACAAVWEGRHVNLTFALSLAAERQKKEDGKALVCNKRLLVMCFVVIFT